MSINLKTLIGKLNGVTREAATRAANICMGLGQYEVEVEHLFLALLEQDQCDLVLVARKCGISLSALDADLRREIAGFRNGSGRTPVFSRHLPLLLEQAWLIASLALPQPDQIRSGHLLLALLTEPELAQLAQRGSSLFGKFPLHELKHQLDKYAAGSVELAALAQKTVNAACDPVTELRSRTPALDQYTVNLTQLASAGRIDPVIGREAEIRQTIDILMRRRQNNPILTGEAGVGKTAVVEGLALRVAAGTVPQAMKGMALHVLDMALLQAGASVKGEFENRLKSVIEEVKKSPHPIVLFIDEAHTIIGAGSPAGQGDAANLLKPALARGELRTIAATTWSEYKQYFEKDAALARRFQVIKVEEPDEENACAMLRAMVPLMERHFGIRVRDDAVREAVRLSQRYISGRQLPDKAVGVLDTACARVALAQAAPPASLEDVERRLAAQAAEIAALERDGANGGVAAARLCALRDSRKMLEQERELLAQRWQQELALCKQLREEVGMTDSDASALRDELKTMQGEAPLVSLEVNAGVVADIVSSWTGIPLGRMVKDDVRTVQGLGEALRGRILGQPHAIEAIAQRVRTSRAGLDDPDKPKGVFLFVGPSGVGKTETALVLADLLYGGERKLIKVNMSEFQEAHSVAGLKGAPAGYVGYGQGGVLTEAVRRNPYSVVLLDEFEKAHPDVLELFYQVFDKGAMDDAEGRSIDFRNTVIIATSNAASATLMQACLNKARDELPSPLTLAEMIRPQLVKQFKPALLGRMQLVPFYPIGDEVLADIIGLKLMHIGRRIKENHHADFGWDEGLVDAVLARCTEVDSGARNVDHVLQGSLLPEVADALLARVGESGAISCIAVSTTDEGKFKYSIR
ncbi:type VI secretion system ATPase TssH [Massilia sp. erpn]|uniref:type VI secretion system ATPase TssH n=1 Tax=Massilia sp. erpn TaxID=2738142 RepID=UPI0021085B08|nr:type VI secretion system ATPase TssH [Massilia sp. erpn]UTY58621.1 type VI secretion system ATPase TssH [Massilia sp. erpn]